MKARIEIIGDLLREVKDLGASPKSSQLNWKIFLVYLHN
jgi:hypothetical protein